MFITLNGLAAMDVATDASLQPEVLDRSVWRQAHSLAEARKICATEESLVRLRGDPRLLLENVLKTAIDHDTPLQPLVSQALANGLYIRSMEAIQRELP